MRVYQTVEVSTRGEGATDRTARLQEVVDKSDRDGLCTVFVQHTSAGLVIQETRIRRSGDLRSGWRRWPESRD
jgi:thiamine phosphate synthase YjbQ (UPF0047 family)